VNGRQTDRRRILVVGGRKDKARQGYQWQAEEDPRHAISQGGQQKGARGERGGKSIRADRSNAQYIHHSKPSCSWLSGGAIGNRHPTMRILPAISVVV